MRTKTFFAFLFVLLALTVLLTACKKTQTEDYSSGSIPQQISSEDYSSPDNAERHENSDPIESSSVYNSSSEDVTVSSEPSVTTSSGLQSSQPQGAVIPGVSGNTAVPSQSSDTSSTTESVEESSSEVPSVSSDTPSVSSEQDVTTQKPDHVYDNAIV